MTKTLLLKIIIGIVAIPTVALGTIYLTRDIPVISKYVVVPLAKFSQNTGLPVIIMPGDNYFKEEAKERYNAGIAMYNRISDKETLIINEERAKQYNSEGISLYQNYNAGVSYADLKIKPYEQFEQEWVEYSKEFYKNNYANVTKEDIQNAQDKMNNIKTEIEKQQKQEQEELEEMQKQYE